MNEAREEAANEARHEAGNEARNGAKDESAGMLVPMKQPAQNRCFGCGAANASGLRLEFLLAADGSIVCLSAISEAFEGRPGCLHGGIIATLLDEVMSKTVRAHGGHSAMTRHLQVDYLRPVPSLAPLRIEGRVLRSKGRSHWAEAQILSGEGAMLAHAKAIFVEPRPSA